MPGSTFYVNPYSNEHALRLKDPGGFDKDSFRRTKGSGDGKVQGVKIPKSISVIWGKLKGKAKPSDPPIAQALRFPISTWGKKPDKAKKWIKDHNLKGKFEAAKPKENEEEVVDARLDKKSIEEGPHFKFDMTSDKSQEEVLINKLKVGEYKYEIVGDETYLIVPGIIIVEGVHNKYLYSAGELKRNYKDWEGVLIPIFHPEGENGEFVSAKSVKEECVGKFQNPSWDEDKKGIRGEFWLQRNKLTDEMIEEMINGNMEVSTGLWATHDYDKSGEWNDEPYIAELSEIEPDHVALLPGHEGACSWADGCGIRVNINQNKGEEVNVEILDDKEVKVKTMSNEEVFEKLDGISTKVVSASEDDNKWIKPFIKFMKSLSSKEGEQVKVNELSHDDVRYTIQGMLFEAFKTPDNETPSVYIRDVFDSYFVFEAKGKLYKQNYSVDSDDQLTLNGSVVEVKLKSEYVELSKSQESETDTSVKKANAEEDNGEEEQINNKEELDMKKEELIKALIENKDAPFCEDDKEFLNSKDEEALKTLNDKFVVDSNANPNSNTDEDKGGEDTASADVDTDVNVDTDVDIDKDDKPLTAEQYLEKSDMPDEVKKVLSDSLKDREVKRTILVKRILDNKKNKFKEEELKSKDISELENIVVLMEDKESDEVDPDFSKNLSGIIGKMTGSETKEGEKNEDGTGVPIAPKPVWNKDGTADLSHLDS